MADERQTDATLDLRGIACPMNWVKARLALERLSAGQLLEITADDGEATLSITKNLRSEGHRIRKATPLGDAFHLVIEVGDD